MFNQPKMAQWLLDHGADQNPKYDSKMTLAISLEKKRTELVEILRARGGIE